MTPKVSVIMGVYNPRGEYLLQAVKSVINQTFTDWELLLYDDGSRAACAGAIRWAAALDSRIRYIRGGSNRGLAHALNVCIRQAKGEYIARMDDDDICRASRLQKQVAFLQGHPRFGWVGSCAQLMDGGGVWGMQRMPLFPDSRDFLRHSPYIHPSVMFRREVLVQSGGYSEAAAHALCEDYELFIRLHRRGWRGCNLPQPLLLYREDRASYAKRTYSRRIREARLRLQGFRQLGILGPGTVGYVLKPLVVGAVPAGLLYALRRRKAGR